MEDCLEKLEQYRLRKRREEKVRTIRENLSRLFMTEKPEESDKVEETSNNVEATIQEGSIPEIQNDLNNDIDSLLYVPLENQSDNSVMGESKSLKYTLHLVCVLFWITVFLITIEFGFGIVFLILSALVGIYFNTRTTPRQPHEMSAYSVFNKNCESIDGTLKAEQFEREIGIAR